jgi:hypothetical protein
MAQSTARALPEQVVHYLRFDVNYDDAGISSGVRKQTLPSGAIILSTTTLITTVFNAVTSNVLTVGINSSSYDNIVSAGRADETLAGLYNGIEPTGTALGKLDANADVYAKYTQTGTAATTGAATVIIQYVVDNDL